MKRLAAVVSALALAGCVTHEVQPYQVQVQPQSPPQITLPPDVAANIMLQCDSLGFYRGSGDHRLCVMRGVDRLRVEQGQPPLDVRPYTAPIQILPHPYPPLAPSNPVYVYPGAK